MAGIRLEGNTSGNLAEINAANQLLIAPEVDAATNPGNVGGIRNFSENDQGTLTGTPRIASPETDIDYRIRVGQDLLLDEDSWYTAQNTGKFGVSAGTMTASFSGGVLTLNSGSTITAGTGYRIFTYATFPVLGSQTLSMDCELGFSAQPQTQVNIEWGLAGSVGTEVAVPGDGVFFRLNSSGLQGIASYNGAETSTGVFPLSGGTGTWVYTNSKRYQFICYETAIYAEFWVNDGTGAVLLGRIPLPAGQGRMAQAAARQAFWKQRIGGSNAGGVIQALIGGYSVRLGGSAITSTASTQGNRIYGSYQGLSGGTMGSLATYVNSTNPTAAAPSNTALTANLPGGLGGQGAVTAAVAAATDGIWNSYQVPAGSTTVQGRRLVVRGYKLDLVNTGAAVATTATTIQFSLAYGHTAVSLATAEGAAAKAPRRVALGFATWAVGAAIGAQSANGPIWLDLGDAPLYVNPGEFFALVGKFLVGTATASQTINFTATPVYGWE